MIIVFCFRKIFWMLCDLKKKCGNIKAVQKATVIQVLIVNEMCQVI